MVDGDRPDRSGVCVRLACASSAATGVDLEGAWNIVRWSDRNLFFGGVSAVEMRADGSLAAAGDPRRGGHAVVVG